MFISERGLELIKSFEGCILQSYDDYDEKIINDGDTVRGTLTIGYGHIEGVYKGQIISLSEAEEMLKNDMKKYCGEVEEVLRSITVPFEINQNVFDSLVSFEYNLGQGNLQTLLANGTRDKMKVANKMLEYINKGSQWEEGLLRRRKAERELFLSDDNSNTSFLNVGNDEIKYLQNELNVQGFRDKNGDMLIVDGFIGELTLSALPIVRRGAVGNITKWIQLRIGVEPDGIFGINTENSLKWCQKTWGLTVDGIVGKETWSEMFRRL